MKTGILVTIISGFGKKGYYHSQEIGLGKALLEMGHEVIIYKGVTQDKEAVTDRLEDGLQIRYIPMRSLGIHGNCPADVIDPDLDGLLSFADTQLFLPHIYRYCRKNKICFVPYIGIAHSFQGNLKSKVMDQLFHMSTLKLYRRIPVLAKTDEVRDELLGLGVKNCRVTPVGLDETELKTDFRDYDRNMLREKYGYRPDDVIICFVARLKAEKRPLDMVDLFCALREKKNARLLMVGEGYQKDEIIAKVDKLGLADYVRMIDRVPYENMWEIHYISDYFVNMRHGEIFGMALMEGIYYESSVVAMEGPGPSFILKGMEGHCLCGNDQEVLQWLEGDRPDPSLLRKSSDKLIEKFSWKSCAQGFTDIIEEYQGTEKK